MYIQTYIHIQAPYTYMHTYTCTLIYTNIHTFTYMHRHIHIQITNARIHTYISIHRCTRTHDYAHVHAIVMQLKIVLMHECKRTCGHVNNHMHTDIMHVHVHTYMLTNMCMLSLSLSVPYTCSH